MNRITVRLNDSEMEKLKRIMAEGEISLSVALRRVIKQDDDLKGLHESIQKMMSEIRYIRLLLAALIESAPKSANYISDKYPNLLRKEVGS